MKRIPIKIVLSCLLLWTCTSWSSHVVAQELNADVKSTMQKISDSFKQEKGCFQLIYQQKPIGETAYVPLSSCEYYKKGDWEKAVFKEYEAMLNDLWYVKAEHEAKKLYLVKFKEEEEEANALKTIPVFNEAILEAYQIEWDSVASNLKEGLLHFKGMAYSNYQGMTLKYNPENHKIHTYIINYKAGSEPGMQALKIDFKRTNCSAEELNRAFTTEHYFTEEKGVLLPINSYAKYQVIKNF